MDDDTFIWGRTESKSQMLIAFATLENKFRTCQWKGS